MFIDNYFKFDNSTIESVPTPIAHALYELSTPKSQYELLILWRACEAVEVCLRTVGCMLLSELFEERNKWLLNKYDEELRGFNYWAPTVGHWKRILDALINSETPATETSLLSLFQIESNKQLFNHFFRDEKNSNKYIDNYHKSFVQLRNRLAHGAGLTGEASKILLRSWMPRIQCFLTELCSLLSNIRLLGEVEGQAYSLSGLDPKILANNPIKNINLFFEYQNQNVRIWPLMLFDKPLRYGITLDDEDYAVQLFSSFESRKRIVYTPYSRLDSPIHWCSIEKEKNIKAFNAFTQYVEHLKKLQKISSNNALNSFRTEIETEAEQMIGRKDIIKEVICNILTSDSSKFWIAGIAGSGKSTLMAGIAAHLISNNTEKSKQLLIPYFFHFGDPRCTREKFIELVGESLNPNEAWVSQITDLKQSDLLFKLKQEILNKIENDFHVIFLLDGIDEINKIDYLFVEEVLSELLDLQLVTSGRVSWILAGRPSVADLIKQIGALSLKFNSYEDSNLLGGDTLENLPRMKEKDIRSLLLSRLDSNSRDKLLRKDNDEQEKLQNERILNNRLLGELQITEEVIGLLNQGSVTAEILRVCGKNENWIALNIKKVIVIADFNQKQRSWLIDDDDDGELYIVKCINDTNTIEIWSDPISNKFISEIAKRSEGLPLYVKLVIEDIHKNQIDITNIRHLPQSLEKYYKRLFEHNSIGGANPLLTPLLCTLAIAKDALTADQMNALIVDKLLPNTPNNQRLFILSNALISLSSLLQNQYNIQGESGYNIFHLSLREFLLNRESYKTNEESYWLNSWVNESKIYIVNCCKEAARNGLNVESPMYHYLAHFGVEHLVEEHCFADALRLFRQLKAHSIELSDLLKSKLGSIILMGLDAAVEQLNNDIVCNNLKEIDPYDLWFLIDQNYETGVNTVAILLLIKFQTENWKNELDERLKEPYDIVFRHDVGEAYAMAWEMAQTDSEKEKLMGEIKKMLQRSQQFYYREIGGYALKHIYQKYPEIIEIDLLNYFASSTLQIDRMIAGELLLTISILNKRKAKEISKKVKFNDFWNPIWNYHRVDINNIYLELESLGFLKKNFLNFFPTSWEFKYHDDIYSLRRSRALRNYAEGLSQDLKCNEIFIHNFSIYLQTTADQLQNINELNSSARVRKLGIEFDSGVDGRKRVVNFIRLLMCHPLWNVTEAASTLAKSLIIENKARLCPIIEDLISTPEAIWTVRYGVIDLAYNIGEVDDNYSTFNKLLLENYSHPHCRIRGICADDLLGRFRLSSKEKKEELLENKEIQNILTFWLESAEDTWLLEYLYLIFRYINNISAEATKKLLSGKKLSPYLRNNSDFYHESHEKFLLDIENKRNQIKNNKQLTIQ